ncbi:hypothetical protein [Nonomuraea basaltis]|uniref:hypothetical protein n=1 Tax=Nonomuraea basaltis TaxID=2495887 RepID=UPI00110C4134|nr:hypothetical protein [Nonomuraea basaltis]TMR88603.1 hypothetical protein EJK15_65255 [Nonomuraea basaltis]
MSDTVRFRVWSEIRDISNSHDEAIVDSEITREAWAAMTEDEQQQVRDDLYQGYVDNRVEGGCEAIEDKDSVGGGG